MTADVPRPGCGSGTCVCANPLDGGLRSRLLASLANVAPAADLSTEIFRKMLPPTCIPVAVVLVQQLMPTATSTSLKAALWCPFQPHNGLSKALQLTTEQGCCNFSDSRRAASTSSFSDAQRACAAHTVSPATLVPTAGCHESQSEPSNLAVQPLPIFSRCLQILV